MYVQEIHRDIVLSDADRTSLYSFSFQRPKGWCCIFVLFCLCFETCRISVPQPGIEPQARAMKGPNPNHQTTRELLPKFYFFNDYQLFLIPVLSTILLCLLLKVRKVFLKVWPGSFPFSVCNLKFKPLQGWRLLGAHVLTSSDLILKRLLGWVIPLGSLLPFKYGNNQRQIKVITAILISDSAGFLPLVLGGRFRLACAIRIFPPAHLGPQHVQSAHRLMRAVIHPCGSIERCITTAPKVPEAPGDR